MADRKDFSDVTWREFFDSKRNRPEFQDRMQLKYGGAFGQTLFKLGREVDGGDLYSYGDDEFVVAGQRGNQVQVFIYAVYRDKVLDDGGTPTGFERPTTEGW